VVQELGGAGNSLSHVQGSAGIADDYAEMARARAGAQEVTGDNRFLDQARAWTRSLNTISGTTDQRLLLLCR
jgi:uncharacterized protein YyaL (SSP411 family)